VNLPENVMKDLLTVVVAGEASPETRTLVEEYARDHPEFARTVEQVGRLGLGTQPLPAPDRELETLKRTQNMFRLKSLLLGLGILLTLLSVRFQFDSLGITWGWQGDVAPRLLMMGLGLAAWLGYFLVARRLRATGL
jgi:hypothetical protein